ncbi:homoserine kinase [Desulforamulus hydrothermalis]|uniref:Homoserine kinase n=1 Tax=Desulforamulus hydrothermalis Lam5 = DSM 18033 TaxID=1121428 RepID=K8E0E3_9FIRM|nr:homoserine kinase [Desulforamulus hydrothermalis]CCO09034.1 Homoserine kinase [Desulforamulus hydrothermalis Lam5 = DSM 18033]SHG77469.1 homoserine kinase [Desulforamulus hydrothermalis Lam5 = DSM 18033]
MNNIRVLVPATTANMGPGFDCLGMALGLYNEVHMALSPGRLSIDVEGEGAADIEKDDKNIVWQAARRVFQEIGQANPGLSIKLINKIPTARGLGSSAAAIVGGLVAANRLTGDTLSRDRLLALATELEGHPDNVAPALLGGAVVSVMAEGKVHYLKINPPEELTAVVAVPDFPLSTQAARAVLPAQVSLRDAVYNLSRTALLVGALCAKRLDLLYIASQDALHQPYRTPLIPGLNQVIQAANGAGALSVTLSGAGPTVIALTDGKSKGIADAMQKAFEQAGVSCRISVLKPAVEGTKIL